MKKIYVLFLASLLMSTQCESDDEPVLRTEFYIQNDSSTELIWISETAGEVVIKEGTKQFIGSVVDWVVFVKPFSGIAFDKVILYRKAENGDLIKTYEQQPIVDDVWRFNALSELEGAYALILTDASLVQE
ncbi:MULTISPECIES: hypothetical protein [Maribacter]|uniref:Uncharacterized protein n=1 Tax=Maribacter flavus TaxID=1658664 RepID=A0ABU7IMK8_9FLAO|nr:MULTISPECIES: hypothetical protein [Maribacter]MDC6406159.1 hypothetical protein [Maribacter sp. PR66]MEE1974202.1 hypothetical protein [Maribacter flavus]